MSDKVNARKRQGSDTPASANGSEREHEQRLIGNGEAATTPTTQTFSPSGVPNLDLILGGGIPTGALTLVMGAPGSGKTSLASQIAFATAGNGQRVLVLTALSESTNKLIEHLRNYTFFAPELIGHEISFFSLQQILSQGLVETRNEILRMTRQTRASLLVMDGFRGIREFERDPSAARQFLYEIGTALGALRVSTLITSVTDPREEAFFPEMTTADVILGLHYHLLGGRQYRAIEVIKARGVAPLPGLHALSLNGAGSKVYPQLEERIALETQAISTLAETATTTGIFSMSPATSATPATSPIANSLTSSEPSGSAHDAEQLVTFGLPQLDALLHGGLMPSTSTIVVGSLGSGKTLLALHFALASVRAGVPVIYLSFREDEEQLLHAAKPFAIGAELRAALQPGGGVKLLWAPPIKLQPDVVAEQLLSHLDATGPCRLVVDSIAELERAIARSLDPDRLEDYLAALMQALRQRRVTTLFVKETTRMVTATLDLSAEPLSILAENVLSLQQVVADGQVRRILSVLKLRYSAHDTSLREFVIAPPDGIRVLGPLEGDIGMLTHRARRQEPDQNHEVQRTPLPTDVNIQ